MNNLEFHHTVKMMRDAQKSFFKTKDYSFLNESKRLEKIVDLELQKLLGEILI